MTHRGALRYSVPLALLLVSCTTAVEPSPHPDVTPATTTDPAATAAAPTDSVAFSRLLTATDGLRDTGTDRFEVWVCEVPLTTTAALYEPSSLRVPLTPQQVADVVQARVPDYFRTLSWDRYRPEFVAGGTVQLTDDQGGLDCVAAAIAGSGPDTTAVLAVATAEHRAAEAGGFGSVGTACTTDCSARTTGRGAYLGASDFHPDWRDEPPMDLVEHEIGHLLGWPHSGDLSLGDYTSALDVMSDSVAPRTADPDQRHGQGTLGINRLAAQWLPPSDVVVAGGPSTVELVPSAAEDGTRLLTLPVDDCTFLTAELLTPHGLDAHLPTAGVVVHAVVPTADDTCGGRPDVPYAVRTVSGTPPFVDLLQAGQSWSGSGWRIDVVSLGDSAVLDVLPAPLTAATDPG